MNTKQLWPIGSVSNLQTFLDGSRMTRLSQSFKYSEETSGAGAAITLSRSFMKP